ncbi:MAG TPA: HEAT repeat domain-containing protein [Vicinamibacterales bacterium]|nr:HEAT repeat domain-containing protein [Vicinamibacterales bacterium]
MKTIRPCHLRHPWLFGLCLLWIGCASTPAPAPDPAAPVQAAFEQKMRWILQLEDQRLLRGSGGDLTTLVTDAAPRVRRRAALAIGRVRLPEGVAALTGVLQADADPEVRQMAAFALGLIGDRSASPALVALLGDADATIQGRAAEALGLLGDKDAAAPIGAMVAAQIDAGVFRALTPDDLGYPKPAGVEAARLGLYALVRLGGYDALAAAVLEKDGRVRSRWWPVAYALQRIGDPRAAPALLELLKGEGQLTRAFAARGLGVLKEARAVAPLLAAAENSGEAVAVRIQAVRAVAAIGDPRGAEVMRRLIVSPKVDINLQLEAVTALTQLPTPALADLLIDLVTAQLPAVRSAALQALARADAEIFTSAVSGFDPDPHWSVRAALASALATLPRERAQPALANLLGDTDQRVIPAVLDALTRIGAGNAATEMLARLKVEDPVVRAAAARNLAALKAANAVPALVEALKTAQGDGLYVARTATLDALTALDPAVAKPALAAALTDRDWAVRMRAAENLRRLDPAADVSSMRPAPPLPAELGSVDALISPQYSPAAYIDTSKGTIQFELAVLDAPRTVANFLALARRNYFRGVQIHRVVPDFVVQDGDPRGDGEGGPGYTIRDEINQRPYLRGTVGMALDWADTGGSQFFITHSPQPHLDGRYTVFGQVVSGMDVVDRLTQWDTIERIRVWDGVNWIGQ